MVVFSGDVKLRNAGLVQDSCQRLAIQSSKKWLHFYWNDLMIFFSSFVNLYMLSLVFARLYKQGAAMS